MNYLKEIIAFNRLAELENLTSSERLLWYALIDICNGLGWAKTFSTANVTLQSKTGLSERTITNARNRLSQRGYITYKNKGTKAPEYGLVSLNKEPTTQHFAEAVSEVVPKSFRNVSEVFPQTFRSCAALNKLNETKPNEVDVTRDAFTVTDEEAQEYRNRIDRIEAKAKSYGLPFATGDIDKALDLAGEYTEEWLLAAIDRCSDRTNRNWGIVKGILRSWKEGGGMDKGYREEASVNWA